MCGLLATPPGNIVDQHDDKDRNHHYDKPNRVPWVVWSKEVRQNSSEDEAQHYGNPSIQFA
jgi:hypothetical protein